MPARPLARPLIGCLLLSVMVNSAVSSPRDDTSTRWAQVTSPRSWSFPRDHGAHPEYRTEWWYFTGNLVDEQGARYGYQLTFFRQGLRWKAADPDNPWSIRDLYFAHLALSDVKAGAFLSDERSARPGPGLAGAETTAMDVWLLGWSARMEGNVISLRAGNNDMKLHLDLTPRKPLVFHGKDGLSKKGPGAGQASYYTSFTDLHAEGWLRVHSDGPEVSVTGTGWFDHEFGSGQLSADQVGWDWFSLHLSDGRDLMIYMIRQKDGGLEPASSGTLVHADGSPLHLTLSDIDVSVLARWRSPKSGARYPSRWRVRIPAAEIDLLVSPLLADQELDTQGSTGVIYWEGAVEGEGTSGGKRVTCEGYVELTGYAGSLGGIF